MAYQLQSGSRTQPLRGLGEVPPGTSEADKNSARRSFYYLYLLAGMAPKLRVLVGAAAGVSVASLLLGPTGLLVGGALAAAALGVVNTVLETTIWAKRSKGDRDAYIKNALIESDTRALLKKAVARLDGITVTDPLARRRQIARYYFLDFIAVGAQSALRSLPTDEQAAFGVAYLDGMNARKSEQACLAAGNAAVAQMRTEKAKAAATAAKAAAIAKAKEQARLEMERAKQAVKKVTTPALAQQATSAVKAAEEKLSKIVADEKVIKVEVEKAKDAVTAPTQAEVEKAVEEAPADAPKAAEVDAGVVPVAKPKATGGGGGLLPLLAAGAAIAVGAPALPVLAVGAGIAVALRKKT